MQTYLYTFFELLYMAIFDRKKEEKEKGLDLPDLPELPNMSDSEDLDIGDVTTSQPYEFPEPEKQVKDLPTFPDSNFGDSLSQEAVKSAIQPGKKLTMDVSEKPDIMPETPMPKPQDAPMAYETELPPSQDRRPKEPFYIRIDKFKFAIDGFEGVKEKIAEVEKYLRKIREQKRREDEEMEEWEKEIEAIKMRIEAIDNKIFSKL